MNGNPERILVRCWSCKEWFEPTNLPSWRADGNGWTSLDLYLTGPTDVSCTCCGAVVVSTDPYAVSRPERSLAL